MTPKTYIQPSLVGKIHPVSFIQFRI